MLALRSLIFSIGMILATVILALPSPILFFVPYVPRYRFLNMWHRFVIWWVQITCNVKYEVEGIDNIAKAHPGIVFSRHESTWETLALTIIFPRQAWVLKRELLWVPFFGWALWVLEPIAINRKAGRHALNEIVKQGIDRLNKGRWVVVFPEGTRIHPEETKKFGAGGAMLAARSGRPVVPVVHNAGDYWARREFIKHPGTIKVIIGEPIQTEGRKAGDINAEAEAWINDNRKKLLALR